MPRVHSIVARTAKQIRSCVKCYKPIEVGQKVYRWRRRSSYGGMTFFQHQECGYPRPSQLYSRKTAQIEDVLQTADFSFTEELPAEAQPGESYEIDTSHVEEVLGEIADIAESVGDEYEESADAVPEALQYGYQAEAMRDVKERLHSWADELRNMSFDTTVELRDTEEDEEMESWRTDMQSLIDNATEKISEDAQDATSEMPEYGG